MLTTSELLEQEQKLYDARPYRRARTKHTFLGISNRHDSQYTNYQYGMVKGDMSFSLGMDI